MSDGVSSNRYRSEIRIKYEDKDKYGIFTHGSFKADYLVPRALNIPNTGNDCIFQMHTVNATLSMAPPIELVINNGKLCFYISSNENIPTSEHREDTVQYVLCDMIYDEWFTVEIDFNLSYSKIFNPYTSVKINGKQILYDTSINAYNLDTLYYAQFGIYAQSWYSHPEEFVDAERTVYIRNITYQY